MLLNAAGVNAFKAGIVRTTISSADNFAACAGVKTLACADVMAVT